jgi:serine/threonine-protein kinase RsbT
MLSVEIKSENDVYQAVTLVNHLIKDRSFNESDKQSIFISVLEVTRNILDHTGKKGIFRCEMVENELRFSCSDKGPGIENLNDILNGLHKSSHGLGVGLAGAKRLMDDLHIETSKEGTRIIGIKRERYK